MRQVPCSSCLLLARVFVPLLLVPYTAATAASWQDLRGGRRPGLLRGGSEHAHVDGLQHPEARQLAVYAAVRALPVSGGRPVPGSLALCLRLCFRRDWPLLQLWRGAARRRGAAHSSGCQPALSGRQVGPAGDCHSGLPGGLANTAQDAAGALPPGWCACMRGSECGFATEDSKRLHDAAMCKSGHLACGPPTLPQPLALT